MIYYRIRPPSSEPLQTFKIRHFPSLRVFIPYQKAPFTAIGKWRSSYPVLTFDLYKKKNETARSSWSSLGRGFNDAIENRCVSNQGLKDYSHLLGSPLIWSRKAMSSDLMVKSTFVFSMIRLSWVDFGKGAVPFSRQYLMQICAGDT